MNRVIFNSERRNLNPNFEIVLEGDAPSSPEFPKLGLISRLSLGPRGGSWLFDGDDLRHVGERPEKLVVMSFRQSILD
jgi:hypothetical protein